MRKFTILLAAALMLCTATKAKTVTPAQARTIAAGYVNLAPLTDAAHTIKVKAASGAMADIYLFNDAKGKGFVLIPGDDCVGNVLGYSHQASIDSDNLPPALSAWLSIVAAHIEAAKSSDLPVISPDKVATKGEIEPLLTTEWDQTEPYYNMTPTQKGTHCLTGCVQTALAQIMKYYEWPANGKGTVTHPVPNCDQKTVTYDLTQSAYDWKNMLDEYIPGYYNTTEGNAVALLMRDIGAVMHASYSTAGTGAFETDAPNALQEYFGYTAHVYYHDLMGNAWLPKLIDELRNSRPVLICGDEGTDGHAFVADGYDADGYLHINWGWSGGGNGYFRMGQLGDSSGEYNYNQTFTTLTPDYTGSAFVEQQNNLYNGWLGIYDASKQNTYEDYTVSLSEPSSETAVSILNSVKYLSDDFEHGFNGKVRLGLYDMESGEYVGTLGAEQNSTITNTPPDTKGTDDRWFDYSTQTLATVPDGHYRVKVESCNTRRDGTYFDEWVLARLGDASYSLALEKSADEATFYYHDDINVTDMKAAITPSTSSVILDDFLPTTVRLEQTNSTLRFMGRIIFNCTDMETGTETAFACTDTLLIYPGEVAKANFDLPIEPTYFQSGHRYRITVSGLLNYQEAATPIAIDEAPVIYVGDMAGISTATTDTDTTATPEYYDLSGRRILTPTSGVTIVRQGKKVGRKVVEK